MPTAEKHIRDILAVAIGYSEKEKALVVFDARCALAAALTESYRRCLPGAVFIDFDATSPSAILAAFKELRPLDLVVLIQSTNFRLEEYRVRVELFNRSLKVIEHPHLANMKDAEAPYYIDALAYDPDYYRTTGRALKKRLDTAHEGVVTGDGEHLVFTSGFEPAKLNIGDYAGMKNIGGQFPIGEVFSEARDLRSVSGRVRIFAFGDTSFKVDKPDKPITIVVREGRLVEALDPTEEFERVLSNIRADEGEVWVRELGFGMNRAFTRERIVSDVGTYERMCGVHLSLGAKHAIYKKAGFTRKEARHHVDVFTVTDTVALDAAIVYRDGKWMV
jgi:hypothetical protein